MKRPALWAAAVMASVAIALPNAVRAQIAPPASLTSMTVGQTLTISKTIRIPPGGATYADIFFLSDVSGSMAASYDDAITRAKNAAQYVIQRPGLDWSFGAGSYNPGYTEDAALSVNPTGAANAVNAWPASGGTGEAYTLTSLAQVANSAGWRTGSQRLLVWFGDDRSATESTTQAQAIAALQGAGVEVLAYNMRGDGSGAAGSGIDQGGQAQAIAAATGGSLYNEANGSFYRPLAASQVYNDILTALRPPSFSNLLFGSTLVGGGLTVGFSCTDVLGCNNVNPGQTRTFDFTVTANTPGAYQFSIFAEDVASQNQSFVVTDAPTSVVPEPSTWILLCTGLFGIGFVHWRRKDEETA